MLPEPSLADFDPYAEWLGVKVDHSPPAPRALLQLASGEASAAVIRKAAAEQSAKVRKYCLGPRGAIANRLLSELANAQNALISDIQTLHDAGTWQSATHAEQSTTEMPIMAEPVDDRRGLANDREIIEAELVRPPSFGDVVCDLRDELVKTVTAVKEAVGRFDRNLVRYIGEENTIVINFVRFLLVTGVFACGPLLYLIGTTR